MKHKKLNELLGVTIVNDMQGIWYAYQPNDNYNTSISEIIKLKEQNLLVVEKHQMRHTII